MKKVYGLLIACVVLAGFVHAEVRNIKSIGAVSGDLAVMGDAGKITASGITVADVTTLKSNRTTQAAAIVVLQSNVVVNAAAAVANASNITVNAGAIVALESNKVAYATAITVTNEAAVTTFDADNTTTNEMADLIAILLKRTQK